MNVRFFTLGFKNLTQDILISLGACLQIKIADSYCEIEMKWYRGSDAWLERLLGPSRWLALWMGIYVYVSMLSGSIADIILIGIG